nr:PIH1 domain containing 2 [Pipistrellus kuhlii]
MGPGIGFRSQWGRGGHFGPGPEKYLKCLKGELRLPSGRQRRHPHLCHRDPLPGGREAPGSPPATRPPRTDTHKHTHTVRRGLAWRGWGRKRTGRKGSDLPFLAGSRAPEKSFPPTERSEASAGRVSRTLQGSPGAGGRRAPFWKGGSGSAEKRGCRGAGRARNWKWEDFLPGALRTPLGATQAGCRGNRRRGLSGNERDLRGLFTSIMESSSNGLLTQVTQFWNLLDDLAESNPESYKSFIQQQLKEGKQLCAAPEPQLCLQTRILKPKEKTLFINLCQWKRIPAPQSTTDPVPLSVGRPEDMSETSDVYTVIDVAYNPDVLQAAEKDQVKKDQLIHMAMKCIEEQLQFTLSHIYHITKFKIKGSIQRMKQNLMGIQTGPTDLREKMRKELTLEQISSSTLSNSDHSPQLLLPKDQVSSKKGCLIEEISRTEIQVEMKRPAYELKMVADENEKPLKIELKVELPGINSVSLCDLSVSEDDLLIEVSEKYRLHLNLPESVDTEMTTAKFIKEKATLIVTMPLV